MRWVLWKEADRSKQSGLQEVLCKGQIWRHLCRRDEAHLEHQESVKGGEGSLDDDVVGEVDADRNGAIGLGLRLLSSLPQSPGEQLSALLRGADGGIGTVSC